jgi:hypothetical protein
MRAELGFRFQHLLASICPSGFWGVFGFGPFSRFSIRKIDATQYHVFRLDQDLKNR